MFRIFAFAYELNDLAQVRYGETSTVHCVATADTDPNVSVLYGDQIIRPVSNHTDLHGAFAEYLLDKSATLHLLTDGLFVHLHNQRLVLGRNPSEDFDSFVKESRRVLFDEIVVDRIGHIVSRLKVKVIDLPFGLSDLPVFIFGQLSDVLGAVTPLFPLDDDHFRLALNHAREEGSLHSQKDVVASDYLSVDVALGQRFDGLNCVLLQLVVEGHDSEEGVVLQEVLSVALQEGSHFLLLDLLDSKGDASVAFQGELFDELVEALHSFGRVLMDHFGVSLHGHEILPRPLAPEHH